MLIYCERTCLVVDHTKERIKFEKMECEVVVGRRARMILRAHIAVKACLGDF